MTVGDLCDVINDTIRDDAPLTLREGGIVKDGVSADLDETRALARDAKQYLAAELIMVGTFYVLEFAAERFPPAALAWNAFHAIIRPVSGMLLALLLLDGHPLPFMIAGSLLGGVLASLAPGVRSGGAVVRWLGSASTPSVLLVSLSVSVSSSPTIRGAVSARNGFGIRRQLGPAAASTTHMNVTMIRSTGRSLGDDDVLAPGGALRGCPVAAYRLPGAPRFALGWVVVRGGAPVFVFRRPKTATCLDFGAMTVTDILEADFFRRVDLQSSDNMPACVFFDLNGPSEASLRAEFLFA